MGERGISPGLYFAVHAPDPSAVILVGHRNDRDREVFVVKMIVVFTVRMVVLVGLFPAALDGEELLREMGNVGDTAVQVTFGFNEEHVAETGAEFAEHEGEGALVGDDAVVFVA
jgi:hypothetical protein